MKKYVFSIMCLLTIDAGALLPPLWNDVAELKEILNDQRLGQFLQSGDSITTIEKKEHGWKIVTNHRTIEVSVHYKKQVMPGKGQFSIEFLPTDHLLK